MRDFILLYINGREHRLRGAAAFQPISDYLRLTMHQCGTKVVCSEGDCGACSVMVGRVSQADPSSLSYAAVNSCIQFAYQLDLAHLITVEGLKLGEQLNVVQQSMVDCNGAQCGYCTPGFVVALCGAANQFCAGSAQRLSEKQVKDALTGNLCRCTGYEAIIKSGMDFDLTKVMRFSSLYEEAPIVSSFKAHAYEQVMLEFSDSKDGKDCKDSRKVFLPATVDSAVDFLKNNQGVTIVSGGTDISVNINKRGLAPPTTMSLCNLVGLDAIEESESEKDPGRKIVTVGARVSLSRLEKFFEKLIPEFYKVLWVYGSPQIRQAGTLAGNIGNGSPIADSLPFLFAVEAEVEVTSAKGSRWIAIESFYTGYKKMAMTADEMITRIKIPVPRADEVLRLYKITRRQHLDISTFTAAVIIKAKSDKITKVRVVLGGVGPVVARLTKVEESMLGKPDKIDTYKTAGKLVRALIEPISDVRGSRQFRLQLAENILSKFYYDVHEAREKVPT